MDARSIAATAANKGFLTPATDLDIEYTGPTYFFDQKIYANRVYNGFGNPKPEEEIRERLDLVESITHRLDADAS